MASPDKLMRVDSAFFSSNQYKQFSLQNMIPLIIPYLVLKIRVHHTIGRACILFLVSVDSVRYTPANAYEMLPKPIQHQLLTHLVGDTFLTHFCITAKSDAISHDPTHANLKTISKIKNWNLGLHVCILGDDPMGRHPSQGREVAFLCSLQRLPLRLP